jgi:hypothetical protein
MPKATTAKPAATAEAAPEFIANIDTANEEVVRLTGELATATTRADPAQLKGADALTDDKSKITGKTGLARAIAANVALQAKA